MKKPSRPPTKAASRRPPGWALRSLGWTICRRWSFDKYSSPKWSYLLRLEIKKTQARLTKLDEAHLRADKRRRGDAKKYIFDHGIKGVRRVMNKHSTVTDLQQVDHKCPTGLLWRLLPSIQPWPDIKAEIETWLATLPKGYDITLSDAQLVVTAKTLTDVPILLTLSS